MAGQDYTFTLQPGQTLNQDIQADFIYCKYVDRPIIVIVAGQRVKMEAGDNYRPGQRFQTFEVYNPDSNPVAVILTAGRGSYSRQIVQGEITTVPGLRKQDGTFISDRRATIGMELMPQYPPEPVVYSAGEKLRDELFTDPEWADILSIWSDGQHINIVHTYADNDLGDMRHVRLNPQTLAIEYTKDIEEPYISTSRDVQLLTRIGGTSFYNSDTYHREIYYEDEDGNHQEFVTGLPEKPVYLSVHPEGLLATLEDPAEDLAHIYGTGNDNWGQLIRTIKRGDVARLDEIGDEATRVMYEPASDQWTIGGTSFDEFGVWSGDLETVEFITGDNWPYFEDADGNGGNTRNTQGPVIAAGNMLYGLIGNSMDKGDPFGKWVIHEETRGLTANAYRPGCAVVTMRPGAVGDNDTTADIEVTANNGQARLSGELVKMALEIYYGRHIKPGFEYMDYVYGFKVESPNGAVAQIQKKTHSGSFAREKIADDFKAVFPATVHLTLIDEISLKAEMEM